jgi:hypothetical protein
MNNIPGEDECQLWVRHTVVRQLFDSLVLWLTAGNAELALRLA